MSIVQNKIYGLCKFYYLIEFLLVLWMYTLVFINVSFGAPGIPQRKCAALSICRMWVFMRNCVSLKEKKSMKHRKSHGVKHSPWNSIDFVTHLCQLLWCSWAPVGRLFRFFFKNRSEASSWKQLKSFKDWIKKWKWIILKMIIYSCW